MKKLLIFAIVSLLFPTSLCAFPKRDYRAMPRLMAMVRENPKIVPIQPGRRFASILSPSFQKISKDRGAWKGYIKGNGHISLRLLISKDGELLSSRYIGHLQQSITEKPTPFKFIGSIPKEGKWSWKIVARVS